MLLLCCRNVLGDEQRYRVELIVLRYLEGSSQKIPVPGLTDYSFALDLLAPPAPGLESGSAGTAETAGSSGEPVPGSAEEPGPDADVEAPRVVLVETPTDLMQQAWQRLRSSPAFRPELYLSWEQAGNEPFPQIRVHDDKVLLEVDPSAAALPAPADGALVFSDTGPGSAASAQALADTEQSRTSNGLPAPPELTRFYRIDGTARLRRSRFLNLDLDIEFREPLDDGTRQSLSAPAPGEGTAGFPGGASFLVHEVEQSRQVQILELQYFDGPVFGVLALVTRVDPVPSETPAADLQAN